MAKTVEYGATCQWMIVANGVIAVWKLAKD
jgi:hypothetical protein